MSAAIDYSRHPLADGHPPHWASGWGEDPYGPWVEIAVGEVLQRLRWCPPGAFWMGSPEGEAGRFSSEGPRHLVTLEAGFWLFDTPVTQALWEAVMGGNPSEFKDPERPVERVSWEEAKGFIEALNGRLPGLELALPSEAQWEYACRAGTEGAIYEEAPGSTPEEALGEIAWYSGNSEGKTHPVGEKRPNGWGLHDMLGNVWEWTEDKWHESYEGAPEDGTAWVDGGAGAGRVVRGGSWGGSARRVRSAYRLHSDPGVRGFSLGFRCARVQS